MRIILCDNCGKRVMDGIYKTSGTTEDFCSRKCAKALSEPKGCQHEDNMSDQVAGRSTVRLICKDCGYDRLVAVGEA